MLNEHKQRNEEVMEDAKAMLGPVILIIKMRLISSAYYNPKKSILIFLKQLGVRAK